MTNRYEEAAREVEARIEALKARLARFEQRGLGGARIASVKAEIAALEAKNLDQWRSTGKWAEEIWG